MAKKDLPDSGERVQYPTGAVREPQSGKGRFDLISPIALMRLAQHYEAGAAKYGGANMRRGIPLSRFFDSAVRHLVRYASGDRTEDHLAAALWNVAEFIHTEARVAQGELPKDLNDLEAISKGEAPARTEVA